MQKPSATDIFNYLRGAIRAAYGTEDLREKRILLVGVGELGQEILTKLCVDGVELYFMDHSVSNYYKAHTICGFIAPYTGEPVDVTLDFETNLVVVNGKPQSFGAMRADPYTQGIHDYYWQGAE